MFKEKSGIILEGLKTNKDELLSVEKDYLQDTFCSCFIGPPASGKTTLIQNLLTNSGLYYKKFHKILSITPSGIGSFELKPGENHWPTIKLSWLLTVLEEQSKIGETENKTRHVLLVFDDVVSDLHRLQNEDMLVKLFYNRRHFLPKIHIHFMITTQKWNMIPARFRSVITMIYLFPLSTLEWKTIVKEVRIENVRALEKLLPLIWREKNDFLTINLINFKFFHKFDLILV